MPRQTKIESLLSQKPAAVLAVKNAEAALQSARAALRTLEADYYRECKRSERRATTQFRYRYLATVRDIYGDCKDDDTFPTKSEAMDWARAQAATIAPDCSVTVERYAVATMTYTTVWTAGNAQSIARWNGEEDVEDPCDAAHRAFVNANDLTD
jgi:hypothetical protein